MASLDVRTYTPSQVIFSFGGASIEGWDSITVTREMPEFKTVTGIRGKNTRVRLNNSAANVEITLLNTSPTNEILSQIVALDKAQGGMRLSFILRDLSGFEVFSSDEAYLEGMPSRQYTDDISERVWIVKCLSSKDSDMGNPMTFGSYFNTVATNIRNMFS